MNSDSTVSERVELKPMSAIQNALCFIGDISGATVYSTNFPNAESMKEIIQVSIISFMKCLFTLR
jgi:deoxycytidylate deaminase